MHLKLNPKFKEINKSKKLIKIHRKMILVKKMIISFLMLKMLVNGKRIINPLWSANKWRKCSLIIKIDWLKLNGPKRNQTKIIAKDKRKRLKHKNAYHIHHTYLKTIVKMIVIYYVSKVRYNRIVQ